MASINTDLRKALEKTVIQARDLAEMAVHAAVQLLGVGQTKAPGHLDELGRKLRVRLREHGRQLGDLRQADGSQVTEKLVQEAAYEHWHRMLFARFLAETGLLIHPDHGISVTLAECEELAQEEGCDTWELAGRYASRMLPQIFRPEDPVLQIKLAPEHQQAIEEMLANLPAEVFQAEDSLGWVYQFWQAKRKDEVNKSEVKIGAEELSAVTQLFTEDYMVLFLLHNSLGAWWAGKTLIRDGTERTEDEWRDACTVNGYRFDFLRFHSDGTPAAGTFDGWPQTAKALTLLDPCMGSGHFLVFALSILVAFRMFEEGLTEAEAVQVVLLENIHGLEIDPRCTQLAAFNLAFAAWRRAGFQVLPRMNIACCGLEPQGTRKEWLELAGEDERAKAALDQLYTLFKQAPLLGSLLNPKTLAKGDLLTAHLDEVMPLFRRALSEGENEITIAKTEVAVKAQGIGTASTILGKQFVLIMTNVPYLGRNRQGDELRQFCDIEYPDSKNDLANVFLERCLSWNSISGTTILVMPQNWLFLSGFKQHRVNLLNQYQWNFVAKLGSGAFGTITGEVVKGILISISNTRPNNNLIMAVSVESTQELHKKSIGLTSDQLLILNQASQKNNPDHRIVFEDIDDLPLLEKIADSTKGITSNDDYQFIFYFWELPIIKNGWEYYQDSPNENDMFSGRNLVVLYESGRGRIRKMAAGQDRDRRMDFRGQFVWGKKGIAVSLTSNLPASIYSGVKFGANMAVLAPKNPSDLEALWCFCSSVNYCKLVRQLDQKMCVTNATLTKVPFDIEYWREQSLIQFPSGLPRPSSYVPSQWTFHGHPASTTNPLQVGVARLLGYRWPAELDESIDLSDEAREWVYRCNALDAFVDEDGIVPVPPMRGEQPAADRLRQLLHAALGSTWSPTKEQELLQSLDFAGKSLETWIRDGFFEQHCKVFQQRPFIWQIWDGLRDGFSVLVNYHKLNRKGLESLTYSYLGDWITRQKEAAARSESGAQGKLEQALELQKKLVAILEGEAPYDIFTRWKDITRQPIGWEPDLNDGVRLNIRPFITASVLRKDPKLNWNKDRGQDGEASPWFTVFGGERINDHHLSLDEKQKARDKSKRR